MFPNLKKGSAQLVTKDESRIESEIEQKQRFLATFSLLLLIAFNFAGLTSIVSSLLSNNGIFHTIFGPAAIIGILICWFCYYSSRHQGSIRLANWLLISYINLLLGLTIYQDGPALPLPAAFLVTMLLSVFLLSWQATLFWIFLELAFISVVYILDATSSSLPLQTITTTNFTLAAAYSEIIIWAFILIIPTGIAIIVLSQLRRVNRAILLQYERLDQAYSDLQEKRQFGQIVGQRVLSVTTELNSTAIQQKSNSYQQAQALEDALITLKELAQAANSIAKNAEDINQDIYLVADATKKQQVLTTRIAEIANESVKEQEVALESCLRTQDVYHQLGEILADLAQRSGEIRKVVSLIEGLSDETHLLSLNAAIEAAGAGSFGERFRVVANQVKALANRSIQASRDVRSILGEIEKSVQQAVQASNAGEAETTFTVNSAQTRVDSVKKTLVVIENSRDEITKISEVVQRLHERIAEISSSTLQQNSNSGQTVVLLEQIGLLAQQNASGSNQVTVTIIDLESLSRELNQVLVA